MIADGAAFGSEIEKVLSVKKARNVIVYLPESFEWLILKSGLIKDSDLADKLNSTHDYVEYFSWERFFTALLVAQSQGTYLQYSKSDLNPVYLQDHEQKSIIDIVPEIIVTGGDSEPT